MGAFSKELWITIIVCVPIILWTISVAESRGQPTLVPVFQVLVLVVGGVVIWRLGGRILEAVTRVWEKIDPTRVWDARPQAEEWGTPSSSKEAGYAETGSFSEGGLGDDSGESWRGPTLTSRRETAADVFCLHCGYSIAANATFCRHCGKKQESA